MIIKNWRECVSALSISALYLGLAAILAIFMFSSCGHNMAAQSKGIGIDVSWSGESYIPNVRLGYWDYNTVAARGNANYTSSTATGSSLGAGTGGGGTSQSMQFSTGTQVNEGNIKAILIDPNLSDDAKIAFINALTKLEKPENDGAINTTSSAQSMITKDDVKVKDAILNPEKEKEETKKQIETLINKLEVLDKEDATTPKALTAEEQAKK